MLERHVERVQHRMNKLEARSRQFWQIKLTLAFAGFTLTVALFGRIPPLGILAAVLTVALFIYINQFHHKVDRSFVRYRLLLQLKETQVARLQLDWEHIPPVQTRDTQIDHPFDIDLDITGERSLHQLINTGVSFEGRHRLREWLLTTTPDLAIIRQRQVLVHELTPLTLFRNKLMLNSLFATRYSAEQLEGQRLLLWLEAQKDTIVPASTLLVPTLLSVITFATLILTYVAKTSITLCLIPLLLSLIWYLITRRNRGTLSADASYMHNAFEQLRVIFEYLEGYRYGKHSNLKSLCEPFFRNPDNSPSRLLSKLARFTQAATVENTELFALVVNAIIPWDIYTAYSLSRYRAKITELLPVWLDIWYELEALSSLANFAYLNPDYVMPAFATKQDPSMLFSATALGHPLIEPEKRVANDITIDISNELLLITGSNMAGKSTFLRTIGINLCLAYAGAPVCAEHLKTSLFEVFACIKVTDSISDGYSYFYAEVRRLKALLTLLENDPRYPVFFLIDEIFKGTNNRERFMGSAAYIHALVGKNCTGAISTHDLELVKLADELPHVRNFHFREEVIDGHMVFDYKLRKGPSPTTNALKIMQLEGLPTTY